MPNIFVDNKSITSLVRELGIIFSREPGLAVILPLMRGCVMVSLGFLGIIFGFFGVGKVF
ncbi:MAG: hypothetical protein EA381_08305 [Planctomycetaceae bacterium]|nr:MAG: hypothetical protein EA381_08305 [Planctomycetaceae bacterium]